MLEIPTLTSTNNSVNMLLRFLVLNSVFSDWLFLSLTKLQLSGTSFLFLSVILCALSVLLNISLKNLSLFKNPFSV